MRLTKGFAMNEPRRSRSAGHLVFAHERFWIPLMLSLALACGLDASEARSPLKGSASYYTHSSASSQKPYHPRQRSVLKADALAEAYKLDGAEALYRRILKSDPANAGAWNGLGKVAWYRTTSSNQNLREQTARLQEQAIDHFRAALRYQPGYVEARVNLASVYMAQGRFADAHEEIEAALALSPRNPVVLARQGEWLARRGQYNEAVPVLEQAVHRQSSNATAHYYLGMSYAKRNELDAAIRHLQTAQYLNPNSAPVYGQLGEVYEKQGNMAAAVEFYQKALAIKPELTQTRLQLAGLHEKQGDTAEALSHLRTVAASGDADWALTNRIARLSVAENQPEMAVKIYREWLIAHPEDEARVNKGISAAKTEVARKRLRRDDLIGQGEAARYAEQALNYSPNNFEARLIDAKLDREIGEDKGPASRQELAMIDVALHKAPVQPYQSFEKGRLLLSRYQFDQAEKALRTARLSSVENRDQMVFAELLLTMGMPSLAEEAFSQVLKQLPGNASAKLGLAKARQAKEKANSLVAEARLLVRGKHSMDIAIEKADAALALDRRNGEAYDLLGALYEKKGDYARAADHYYAWLKLNPYSEEATRVKRKIDRLKERMVQSR